MIMVFMLFLYTSYLKGLMKIVILLLLITVLSYEIVML